MSACGTPTHNARPLNGRFAASNIGITSLCRPAAAQADMAVGDARATAAGRTQGAFRVLIVGGYDICAQYEAFCDAGGHIHVPRNSAVKQRQMSTENRNFAKKITKSHIKPMVFIHQLGPLEAFHMA